MPLTLAITGGTGFVGSHTLAAARARGHNVRALARRPQPPLEGVIWVPGALTDAAALADLVQGADVVIHIAGVTNAASPAAFVEANVLGTAFLRRAAATRPLVHVSSLSAREPRLSRYGASKLQGEGIARGFAGKLAILRPPAVYGPGNREFLSLLKAARTGWVPVPAGSTAAMLYGPDLAAALIAIALDLLGPATTKGACLEIDDGAGGYPPAALAAAMGAAVGRTARPVPIPPALLKLGAFVDTALSRPRGRLPALSHDRAGYMAHPDWSASNNSLLQAIWQPATKLAEGMAQTAGWYRSQGLLP